MRFTGYGSVALAEQGAIANDRGRLSQETAESGIARKPLQVLIFIIRVTRVAGHHTTFGQSAVAKTYPAEDQVKDRKSTRLNSSHIPLSRMPSSA